MEREENNEEQGGTVESSFWQTDTATGVTTALLSLEMSSTQTQTQHLCIHCVVFDQTSQLSDCSIFP